MKVVFRGATEQVGPRALSEPRTFAEGHNTPDTVRLVLGAMEGGGELVLQNTRLTAAERSAQRDAIAAIPAQRDPALVLFTSGTTGTPKAARLSRENLEANARGANEVLEIDAASKFLCVLPLFHVGGLGILFRCQLASATVVLHERFDAGAAAQEFARGVTHASLVASTLARVLEAHRGPFPPVIVAVGGGPVPAPLLQRARDAGLRVVQTWGMTETCSMATCERPNDADGTTAGPGMPGFDIRIDGGEIVVRGAAVLRAYLGHPPLGAWFRTGDLGELDGRGRLVVHARRSDLIVSGGENVYPAEVEAALLAHRAVREAAVLPAHDEKWGQVGVAYVVSAAPERELREHLAGRLARYKIPVRFVYLAELPRNASGKVDRVTLLSRASRGET